jgi:hypothetical protein
MPIETACNGCGKRLRVADEHAGKLARCPACSSIYRVPGESALASGGSTTSAASADQHAAARGSGTRPDPTAQPAAATFTPREQMWRMRTPEGQVYGPVPWHELESWLAEGRISDECELESDGVFRSADLFFPQLREPAMARDEVRGNPYQTANYNPYQSGPVPRRSLAYQQPDRGGTILAIAIMSWLFFCPALSLAAWMMGHHDLAEMRAGRMDRSGEGMTHGGYVLGMIHFLLAAAVLTLMFLASFG